MKKINGHVDLVGREQTLKVFKNILDVSERELLRRR